MGVLRSLHEAVAQLGTALQPYLGELLASLVHLLLYATHCVCEAPAADGGEGGEERSLLSVDARLDPSVPIGLCCCRRARSACGR